MIIFNWLSIFFSKFELNFVGEEKFHKEIHNFGVLLIFKVVIQEHLNTACNQQFPTAFMLMNGYDGSIAWICQWSRS